MCLLRSGAHSSRVKPANGPGKPPPLREFSKRNRRRLAMSLLRNLAGGLLALPPKKQAEREMDEELRGDLDAAVLAKMRRGMTPEDAVRAARMDMGGAEKVKEQIR